MEEGRLRPRNTPSLFLALNEMDSRSVEQSVVGNAGAPRSLLTP